MGDVILLLSVHSGLGSFIVILTTVVIIVDHVTDSIYYREMIVVKKRVPYRCRIYNYHYRSRIYRSLSF